jgi:hypothetical protein
MPIPLLFAWFSNPAMLWGLGAASIPLIIHLLNRRRFREEPWAAMRFLLAALRKNQRRVRIEQWLLLAVRTLVVLFAVLAMAKPFLERLGASALLPGQRTHWVLVLDGSLSMSRAAAETSRFDSAKALAAQLVRATRQGDGVSVLLMGDPPRAVIGAPSFSRDAVLKEVADIVPTHGATDLPASFAKVEEAMAASDIPRKHLVIITDLQAASWNRSPAGAEEGLRRSLANLEARKAHSSVIDLGAADDANRAVTDLRLDPPVVTPTTPAMIQATVRGFGPGSGGEVRARLIVDGRMEGEQAVELAAGEEKSVAFVHQFTTPGDHVVEVQTEPDALKPDDARRLVVPVRPSIKVLLVDGDPDPEPLQSETSFLAEALSPEPDGETPVSPITYEVISDAQLAGRDLAPYDAVVLADVARFSPAEAAALGAFLKLGGGVVVFAGDQAVADNYNQVLYAAGKGLLPAELGDVVGNPARQERPFEFDPLGFRHPIVAAFAGASAPVAASLTGVKTGRYVRLKPAPGSPARVALAFSSGDPAVVEWPHQRGRVVLLATSADTSWTTWPLHQSYPPVMEQVVLLAASGRASERNVRVGQPLVEAFPPSGAGAPVTVRRPAGEPASSKLVPDGDVTVLRYDATDLSGTYAAAVGPPIDREATFAANPDPAESDPTKLDASALRAALPGWEFVYESDWRPLVTDAASVGHRGELHRPLLWGLLGLLLFESFLAWKFSHHAVRAR